MNISEVKDLMAQFDQSSLREFSFKTADSELTFSKNEYTAPVVPAAAPAAPPAAAPAPTATGAGQVLSAPMPGLILRIEAKAGQSVKKNQLVMVMEAMKMENEIYAPCDGTISSIAVSQGQQVAAGDALLTIA